jgi:threonine dehydrogenase-like Zn-dependent dehydrogenase
MVTGVFRYANVYPMAVNLLAGEALDTRPLVTHRYAFPRVAEALAFVAGGDPTALKTMVTFD